MIQPPLDQHYVVMHLGGGKKVSRARDGQPLCTIADSGSLTLVPAGTAYTWRTEGPIAFAHLYLNPSRLEDCAAEEGGPRAAEAALMDRVGCRDPQLEPLYARMLGAIEGEEPASPLLLDSLLESFCVRLLERHVERPAGAGRQAVALAPYRLRRVLEFIEAHIGQAISLADLVAAAGTSQFHFSRAFHLATGCSPYRYVVRRRIAYARVLLITGNDSLTEISAACGFSSRRQFGVQFMHAVGMGPKRFRLDHRAS